MALNESKGNMYSWITHTWNTVKGECPHGCTYCYMHRWGKQRPVRFDESELKTDLGSGNFIFVGSSCDLFANGIDRDWITKTLNHCSKFDNTYLFQSKNTGNMYRYIPLLPLKSRLCTTFETNRWMPEIMKDSPKPINRLQWAYAFRDHLMKKQDFELYITMEPIMDFDIGPVVQMLSQCKPIQVNIGADSGNNHLPEPSKGKLLELIAELKRFTVIDQKRNLNRLLR